MSRNNTIGIVGTIATPPQLVVDAASWKDKLYETTLTRTRPSDTEDTFILQFDGRAAGSEEMLAKITEGVEVLIGGEIRTQNLHNPQPEENRVKVYIYAEVIAVNDPPADDQNEVKLRGRVCKPPQFRKREYRTPSGKRISKTNILIAVNTPSNSSYIPCICLGETALSANALKIGDYVEIYGHFLSRKFKKKINGRELPFLSTTYEVCTATLESDRTPKREETGKGENA